MRQSSVLAVLFLVGINIPIHAQSPQIGSVVTVQSSNSKGVPGHKQLGGGTGFDRIPNGTACKVTKLGAPVKKRWIQVAFGDKRPWIITKYVASVAAGTDNPAPTPSTNSYVIGCWNLEHFGLTSTRGFPENTRGGPTYPMRDAASYRKIANTISQKLNAQLLLLSEIKGENIVEDGDTLARSESLDRLLRELPNSYDYTIGYAGGKQRLAFLYNTNTVEVHEVLEFQVLNKQVQGKGTFDRKPLAAYVTLKSGTTNRNDLVIVGVHLASGQRNNKNHDAAMKEVRRQIKGLQAQGDLGGSKEQDILIMGDFNANMFQAPIEQFFLTMDDTPDTANGFWDVLAGDNYPVTRLSGTPLKLRSSTIDYIISSRFGGTLKGLVGEEITAKSATVHTELLPTNRETFRKLQSDHLPVTIRVKVMADTDRQ